MPSFMWLTSVEDTTFPNRRPGNQTVPHIHSLPHTVFCRENFLEDISVGGICSIRWQKFIWENIDLWGYVCWGAMGGRQVIHIYMKAFETFYLVDRTKCYQDSVIKCTTLMRKNNNYSVIKHKVTINNLFL